MYSPLFSNNEFFIDEKVRFLRLSNEYKIYNNQGQPIGMVYQKIPGLSKILHLIMSKVILPFTLEIQDIDSKTLLKIKRGWTFWMSKIKIVDSDENILGYIKQKFSFLKPTFTISNAQEEAIGEIKGDWKAWDFTITDNSGQTIGHINKKWAGALKEIFTTSDKYYVKLDPSYTNDMNKNIILAAALTIDMVLKESR